MSWQKAETPPEHERAVLVTLSDGTIFMGHHYKKEGWFIYTKDGFLPIEDRHRQPTQWLGFEYLPEPLPGLSFTI